MGRTECKVVTQGDEVSSALASGLGIVLMFPPLGVGPEGLGGITSETTFMKCSPATALETSEKPCRTQTRNGATFKSFPQWKSARHETCSFVR